MKGLVLGPAGWRIQSENQSLYCNYRNGRIIESNHVAIPGEKLNEDKIFIDEDKLGEALYALYIALKADKEGL